MADRFSLRAAAPGDAAALAALIRRAFAAQPVPVDPPLSALGVKAAFIRAHFARGGGGFLIEGPLGAVLWGEVARGLHVSRLAVHPAWRGHGLAGRLLAAVEELARTRSLPCLYLSTRLTLRGNRRLFAANGFIETALHAHPGYAMPTYVDLEKRLA